MNNIITLFEDIYLPKMAIIIYYNSFQNNDYYVESYDMDENGSPINAHPLSASEASALAKALDASKELQKSFLKPNGLLPENLLYLDPSNRGCAIWYTPPQQQDLFFAGDLGINSGKAHIPALLWKASKTELFLYALTGAPKPKEKTSLYHAPFFNLHQDGKVCMGTVEIEITEKTSLEAFMENWQHYFFNSYFSHLIDEHNPVKGNIVQLWQQQVTTGKPFPCNQMKKNKLTLKDLIR